MIMVRLLPRLEISTADTGQSTNRSGRREGVSFGFIHRRCLKKAQLQKAPARVSSKSNLRLRIGLVWGGWQGMGGVGPLPLHSLMPGVHSEQRGPIMTTRVKELVKSV